MYCYSREFEQAIRCLRVKGGFSIIHDPFLNNCFGLGFVYLMQDGNLNNNKSVLFVTHSGVCCKNDKNTFNLTFKLKVMHIFIDPLDFFLFQLFMISPLTVPYYDLMCLKFLDFYNLLEISIFFFVIQRNNGDHQI